jgi:putative membrane protein
MKNLIILLAGVMAPAFSVFAEMRDIHDAHIADVVVTASGIAIEAGRLAQSKSSNEDIKAYAERMVGEHTEVSQSAIELVTKLKVELQDNPISQSLRADGETDLTRLQALRGQEFDKAYIDQKVVLYQHVLDTIDNRLMPNASNEELKVLLYKLFAPFSLHLEDAQQIQESLSKPDRLPDRKSQAPGGFAAENGAFAKLML